MPRKKIQMSSKFPYHISARCINREWFDLPLNEVWLIMEDYLYFVTAAYDLAISSFVLMSNHFHLIAEAPSGNLSEAMTYFMRETSRAIGKAAGRINQTYGARYRRTLISRRLHFQYAYKYVYRNPVKAGLVSRVEDYQYSTLPGLLGKFKINIPIVEDSILFSDDPRKVLDWLNCPPDGQVEEDVRKAIRRSLFRFPTHNSNRKSKLEETLLY